MRAFRKRRRPGNRPLTAAQLEHVYQAKTCCIPCLVWAMAGNMAMAHVASECDYNHVKSGNLRRGHDFGYGGCVWHHRGRVGDGWSHSQMRQHFGPSLMDGSRLFHETYGTDDELLELQRQVLEGAA